MGISTPSATQLVAVGQRISSTSALLYPFGFATLAMIDHFVPSKWNTRGEKGAPKLVELCTAPPTAKHSDGETQVTESVYAPLPLVTGGSDASAQVAPFQCSTTGVSWPVEVPR